MWSTDSTDVKLVITKSTKNSCVTKDLEDVLPWHSCKATGAFLLILVVIRD